MVAIAGPFASLDASADALRHARWTSSRGYARRGSEGVLLLAAAPAVLMHLLLATRGANAPAGPGEALTIAAAQDAALPVAAADVPFVRQLAAVQALVAPPGGADLLVTARAACVLAGLLGALLLWSVARRLLPDRDAAAAAVVVAGSTPVALLLHVGVDAGAFAALWLVAAAALGVSGSRAGLALAAVGVAGAVLTAPLVAAGVLALVAHLAVRGAFGVRRRGTLAAVAGAGGLGIAVLAAVRVSPTTSAGAVGLPLVVVTAVLGAALVGAAWWRAPRLRPVATGAVVWLGCALWPGPAQLTALLLAAPALALLAGALIGVGAPQRRLSAAAVAAVAVALTVGLVLTTAPLPLPTPVAASHRTVAQWLAAELDPSVPLRSDALGRAELIAEGVPADRFVDGVGGADAVRVADAGLGCVTGEFALARMAAAGGGTVLCRSGNPAAAGGTGPDIGPALATNRALTLSLPAREALTRGRVDERLTVALAGATAAHRITIADFPAAPGARADVPRRAALVTASTTTGTGAGLEAYLAGQLPPYRPEVSRQPDGGLLVRFRVPPAS